MDQGTPPPNGKQVLVIEDEHFISELYVRALTKAGYKVTVMVDGLQGFEQAKTNQFDIILLDVMIPNMTGTEILKQLKSMQPPIKSKIIITTNLDQGEDGRKAVEQQADGYIIKAEVTPKQLVNFIDALG